MSKPIKITEEYMKECREDFEKILKESKLTNGQLSFLKDFSCDEKATVYIAPRALAKMFALIREFDNEIAWHGVASRNADSYVISDILVYPQTVSGVSVEMDETEYAKWLMENADDERFDRIRMQGHSHVNMSTTPSTVDLQHQQDILNMLGDDDFYIFMILNKRFEIYTRIYDMAKNIVFDPSDVTIKITGAVDIEGFLQSAKELVKVKAPQKRITLNDMCTVSTGEGTLEEWEPSYDCDKGFWLRG